MLSSVEFAGAGGGGFLGICFWSEFELSLSMALPLMLESPLVLCCKDDDSFGLAPAANISPYPMPLIGLGLLSCAAGSSPPPAAAAALDGCC